MAEKTQKNKVLHSIGKVCKEAKNCKLDPVYFELMDGELSFLADYFHISKTQALWVSVIFIQNFKGHKVKMGDLVNFFDCEPMKLLEYNSDFKDLYEKRLLRKSISNVRHRSLRLRAVDDELYVNEMISEIILRSESFPETMMSSVKFEDIYCLLEKINTLITQREEEDITTDDLFEQTQIILKENADFPLIEKIQVLGFSLHDQCLFLFVVWNNLDGIMNLSIDGVFRFIYDKANQRFNRMQKFLAKENPLLKEGWLEMEDGEFFDYTTMKLTVKAIDLLIECDLKIFRKSFSKKEGVFLPDQIPYRKLIYSMEEFRQLDLLQTLLKEDNLKNTQARLAERSLPKGITALLHGAPGTGKTESVLQMAKATNREIMKVDISATRTSWFGESEKIIKQVFKDYQEYIQKQKTTPILFFNEADAILAKRKEANNSNVSDTENRIQNILLEELENFEGILMATTNLADNFDRAFERRFLFKIHFHKPQLAIKTQIWKAKLPHLPEEECEILAGQFDFSGGQIDNVVRKNEIHEIIHGIRLDLNSLIEFCKEESIRNEYQESPIGFKRN